MRDEEVMLGLQAKLLRAVERLDGFDEGFKPQWKAEFAKRGIEVVGPVAQSAGEEVHREYVRRHPTVYMPNRG